MKEAEVLATDADGRAEQVRFVLDAGAIKDDHTLAYTWGGDGRGRAGRLVKPARCCARSTASYALADAGRAVPRSPTSWPSTSRSRCSA